MNADLFLDLFVALFALLNPLFTIPVFLGLTRDCASGERQRIAAAAALTLVISLIIAAVIGDQLLLIFGINVPSFQIAGGLIVLTIALSMLKGENEEDAEANETIAKDAKRSKQSIAIYPLAIPLLAGPGVFVTTIVFASRIDSMADFISLSSALVAISLMVWLSMAGATTITRFINKASIMIGTKILGILLAAVAVEMTIAGIDAHFFPHLAKG